MLKKPQPTEPTTAGLVRVRFKAKQKRNPRKLIEALPNDWARWEKGAEREGVNFNEFTRRALEARYREFKK